jgi:carboxypeptidase family protein
MYVKACSRQSLQTLCFTATIARIGRCAMRHAAIRTASLLILLCGIAEMGSANTCTYKRVSVKDVCGQVVAWPTREPIPEAEVTVLTTTGVAVKGTHANQNGMFTVAPLPKGNYRLRVTAPDFDTLAPPIHVSKGKGACKRLLVFGLAPHTGMGCFSPGIIAVEHNKARK